MRKTARTVVWEGAEKFYFSLSTRLSKPKEYYQELLDGFAASGKSFSEFCIDNGISKNTFYYAKDWLELLERKDEKEETKKE